MQLSPSYSEKVCLLSLSGHAALQLQASSILHIKQQEYMSHDSSILSGLNEYTTFRVSVAANNSFGIGPYSQPMEVKTQESSKSRLH